MPDMSDAMRNASNDNDLNISEDALTEYSRKELIMILKRCMQDKKEIGEELDRFTYIVTHDLKALLRSIESFSGFLLKDCSAKLSDDENCYLKRIGANAARMNHLMDDLLELSRIGRLVNPPEQVPVDNIIDDAVHHNAFLIKEKNAEIVRLETFPEIMCDRVRMTDMFANLIANAVKFCGKKDPRVELGFNEKDESYEFFVKDNGPGIKEENLKKIFDVFWRSHEHEELEGTGAGLTIAKKIVHMHGGHMWAESVPEQGLTIYFTLPKNQLLPPQI